MTPRPIHLDHPDLIDVDHPDASAIRVETSAGTLAIRLGNAA